MRFYGRRELRLFFFPDNVGNLDSVVSDPNVENMSEIWFQQKSYGPYCGTNNEFVNDSFW